MYGGEALDTEFLELVKVGQDVPRKYWLDAKAELQEEVVVSEELPHIISNEAEDPIGTLQCRLLAGDYDIDVKVSMNCKEKENTAITRRGSFYVCMPQMWTHLESNVYTFGTKKQCPD